MTGLQERLIDQLRFSLYAAIDRVLMVGDVSPEDATKIADIRSAIVSEAIGNLSDVAMKILSIPAGTRRVLCQLESDGIQFKKANIEAKIICQDTEANILDLRVMRGQWVEICATQLEIPETMGSGGGQMTIDDLGPAQCEITPIDPPAAPAPAKRKRRTKAEMEAAAAADAQDAPQTANDETPEVIIKGTAEVSTAADTAPEILDYAQTAPPEAPAPEETEDAASLDELTEEQDTALTMMIEGKSVDEIAAAVGKTPRTVARWKKIPVIANALIAISGKAKGAE